MYTRRQASNPKFGRNLVDSVVDTITTGILSGSWAYNLNTWFLLEEGRCNLPLFPKMGDEECFPLKPRQGKTGEESPPGTSWGEERNLCWCCWLWWGQQLCRTGWQGYGNVGKYNSDSQQLILCVSVGVVTFVCCIATFSKIDWNYLKHENTFFCRLGWIRSFYIVLCNYVDDALVLVSEKNWTVDVFKEFLRWLCHDTIQNNTPT